MGINNVSAPEIFLHNYCSIKQLFSPEGISPVRELLCTRNFSVLVKKGKQLICQPWNTILRILKTLLSKIRTQTFHVTNFARYGTRQLIRIEENGNCIVITGEQAVFDEGHNI